MSETLVVDAVAERESKMDRAEMQGHLSKMEQQITSAASSVDDGGGVAGAIRFGKRRKTRRGKPKRRKLKPYSRLWLDDKHKSAKYSYGQPEAPYNTTQFLIADHNDLQGLDDQLRAATNAEGGPHDPPPRPARARDSSFSVDSDEDYFYSSPEDEGDFLSKEFSNTYEDLHAERIGAMSKTQLIQEYLMLEEKVGLLETRLKTAETKLISEDLAEKTVPEEFNVSETLLVYKQEIEKLHLENQQLRRENDRLRCAYAGDKSLSVSSVDSESDSSSSSSCSGSESCSSDVEEAGIECSAAETPEADAKISVSEDADPPASGNCDQNLK